MKITVNYFGQLRQITGKDTDGEDCPEQTGLAALISNLALRYGDKFSRIVLDEAGQLRPSILISVNGNIVDKKSPPALKDGDQVSLLTAMAGG